jgi:hypothetical protein
MSDYEVTCENIEDNDLGFEMMVNKADKAFPDGWAEIRMDKSGRCYAYTSPPQRRTIAWWGFSDNAEFVKVGKGRLEWNWQTFGIIRTPEAKPAKTSLTPERGKKAEQVRLLSAYAAELGSELSATRAMLAESQREIAELRRQVDFAKDCWYGDGWDSGAAAMLKAAQNAEAVLIYEANGGEMDMQAAMGAARVVGALGNELARGMLTGKGE